MWISCWGSFGPDDTFFWSRVALWNFLIDLLLWQIHRDRNSLMLLIRQFSHNWDEGVGRSNPPRDQKTTLSVFKHSNCFNNNNNNHLISSEFMAARKPVKSINQNENSNGVQADADALSQSSLKKIMHIYREFIRWDIFNMVDRWWCPSTELCWANDTKPMRDARKTSPIQPFENRLQSPGIAPHDVRWGFFDDLF